MTNYRAKSIRALRSAMKYLDMEHALASAKPLSNSNPERWQVADALEHVQIALDKLTTEKEVNRT